MLKIRLELASDGDSTVSNHQCSLFGLNSQGSSLIIRLLVRVKITP